MHIKISNQHGAYLLMTLFLLIILIGISGLALDFGRMYVLRTEMQNAVDAAALAAAGELDGLPNARLRARRAASLTLNDWHRARFSPEDPDTGNTNLLSQLSNDDYYIVDAPQDSAFVFYRWIGHELEGDQPDDCDIEEYPSEEGKCVTTDDLYAHYVKVRLSPEITAEKDYGIDFYFLPVLFMFTGDALTSSTTKVSAVAGSGSQLCYYPPMFMCSLDEGDPVHGGLTVGQQIRIKEQQSNWQPGNFGFLAVRDDEVPDPRDTNPDDGQDMLKNQEALMAALANEKLQGCTPAIVETETGNKVAKTRYGLNTRFGLYQPTESAFFNADGTVNDFYAAAPNVVDYPRDLNLATDPDEHWGTGWDTPSGQDPANPNFNTQILNQEEFLSYYHSGDTLPAGFPANGAGQSRYDFYEMTAGEYNPSDDDEWTHSAPSHSCYDAANPTERGDGTCPSLSATLRDDNPSPQLTMDSCLMDNDIDGSVDQQTANFKNADCALFDGRPIPYEDDTPGPGTDTIPPIGTPDKRILFIARINCSTANINGTTKGINMLEHGRFIRMFLTEHVLAPAGASDKVDVYAEYLGPVSREERQELVHTIVQLYE